MDIFYQIIGIIFCIWEILTDIIDWIINIILNIIPNTLSVLGIDLSPQQRIALGFILLSIFLGYYINKNKYNIKELKNQVSDLKRDIEELKNK